MPGVHVEKPQRRLRFFCCICEINVADYLAGGVDGAAGAAVGVGSGFDSVVDGEGLASVAGAADVAGVSCFTSDVVSVFGSPELPFLA